jgi:hypothetical protein
VSEVAQGVLALLIRVLDMKAIDALIGFAHSSKGEGVLS